jgi:hypothetical protein
VVEGEEEEMCDEESMRLDDVLVGEKEVVLEKDVVHVMVDNLSLPLIVVHEEVDSFVVDKMSWEEEEDMMLQY